MFHRRVVTRPKATTGRLWAGQRVGLLGGSFNPAHDGHRHISLAALKALDLDQVWWLVSPQNPLKPKAGMASLADRMRHAKRVAGHGRIVVTDLERQLGTRYTADTLPQQRQSYPKTEFVWLMGADNLAQMARWDRWPQVFRTVPIAVFDRSGHSLTALRGIAASRFAKYRVPNERAQTLASQTPPAWMFFHIRRHPASSTALRQANHTPWRQP